jgi:hypothetical protein
VPNPLLSDREFERFNHFDLGGLTDLALWKEAWRAKSQLAFQHGSENTPAVRWLLRRIAAVRAELQARGLNDER